MLEMVVNSVFIGTFSGHLVLPHYRTILIATINFSNKSKAANIMILYEKYKTIKHKQISHI